MPSTSSAVARFEAKYCPEAITGCWLWLGSTKRGSHRYGFFHAENRVVLAHRWSYQHFIGPIPVGLELDHKCRTPQCVNPLHLEPVTHLENVRRGVCRKTHCKHGHPLSDTNTYLPPGRPGIRVCLKCKQRFLREHKARKRARRG